MIDFELTEDHRALVQTVRSLARRKSRLIKEWDEKQQYQPGILKKWAITEPARSLHSRTIRRRRLRLHFAGPSL